MRRRLPSLTALRAFEATARLGALNRAAEELAVTESAISRQIRTLEEEMAVDLLRRVHRGVKLTPEGVVLAEALADGFDRMRRGIEKVQSRPAEVRLRVPPTFGTRWMLPRLAAFESAHPDVRVRVSILLDNMTPDDMEHDLGIIYPPTAWPTDRLINLFREKLTPVCAPATLRRFGALDGAEALARAPLLHCSVSGDWRTWLDKAGYSEVDADRGEVFDTMDMALRAAESGRGFAIADLAMIAEDLALGRLVAASRFVLHERVTYWLVRRDPQRRRPEIDRFVAWLLAEAAATDAAW